MGKRIGGGIPPLVPISHDGLTGPRRRDRPDRPDRVASGSLLPGDDPASATGRRP
jgi:hypothetical protein